MAEHTYYHKRHLGEALLVADNEVFADSVVPAAITPATADWSEHRPNLRKPIDLVLRNR